MIPYILLGFAIGVVIVAAIIFGTLFAIEFKAKRRQRRSRRSRLFSASMGTGVDP